VEEVKHMRKSYKSFSFKNFLDDLREEIRFSKYTQESIALNYLNMARETLCRKLANGDLTAKQLYTILVVLGIL